MGNGTDSGQCPVADSDISAESSGYINRSGSQPVVTTLQNFVLLASLEM